MRDELRDLDAVGQAELVARGETSALELVDAAIARIEKVEPEVHALASADFEAARARARGAPTGPFGGVPFLIKDLLGYPGHRVAFGARLFRENIAHEGSPYTARLDASGLITLGKTTTSEFGMLGSTESRLYGITKNPWDLEKSAMGSSGGAAAAVASGMVPIAHASDGGGSIRIPGSACGLFAFKPGRGRAVASGPVDPAGLVIEHCLSRTVRDSALFLSVTEDASGASGSPVGHVTTPIDRPLRIGVYTETLMGRAPDAEVASALARTATLCRELGHELVDVPSPPLDGAALSDAFFTWAGGAMHGMQQMMQPMLGRPLGEEDLEPFTLALIAWFARMPEGAMARALSTMAEATRTFVSYLGAYDVMLCPTIPIVPWPLGTMSPELDRETLIARMQVLAGYTCIHNMAGVPAMSVPLFTSTTGLPIGSHFAAGAGQEATLLGLAYQLEHALPWRDRWPTTRA